MKRLITLFVIVLVLFLLERLVFYKDPFFRKIKLDKNSSYVYNTTNQVFLDTIVYVGLEHLDIPDVIVIIKSLENHIVLDEGQTTKAYIVGQDKQFVIYTARLSRSEALTIIAHELIHLKQYYTRRLVVKDSIISWEKRKAPILEWYNLSYNNRPWEIEAFKLQGELSKYISSELYL